MLTTKPLTFLWLEITGTCNLSCTHCYAESSSYATHGMMRRVDWERVIAQAQVLGCRSVQFIGGEPTVHPDLAALIRYAHRLNMDVEIYTNLVAIKPALWEVFLECQVRLATSFYSTNASIHEQITRGRDSFQKTVKNIKQVMSYGLPLRAGLIDLGRDQGIDEAKQMLQDLGVQHIGIDRVRSVGRGSQLTSVDRPEEALCGSCARGRAAILPSGAVYPCVFARWLLLGNVMQDDLSTIVASMTMQTTRQELQTYFDSRFLSAPVLPGRWCEPDDCPPNCEPGECPPKMPSCPPTHLCPPDFMPCPPEKYPPCPPDEEKCPPDWDEEEEEE